MHRISQRQDIVLKELQDQARSIEELSREEREILKELHPDGAENRRGRRSGEGIDSSVINSSSINKAKGASFPKAPFII